MEAGHGKPPLSDFRGGFTHEPLLLLSALKVLHQGAGERAPGLTHPPLPQDHRNEAMEFLLWLSGNEPD